jgi:hypothetical protein
MDVLKNLAEIGLFIVPNGEMESWDKSLSAVKPDWIIEALVNIASNSASFAEAANFIQKLVVFLSP